MKLLFSHSIVSYWRLVNNTVEVWKQNWQSVTNSWMGWKMPLCKWHYTFWMAPYLIFFFFLVILFYIERKWLLVRNVALKPYYVSERKIFFKEIYRNIQIFAFKLLQECSSWASRNGLVQIFFLTPHKASLLEDL